MTLAKTFGIWFLLGAGLLLSGFFCVEAIREYQTESALGNVLLLLSVFAVAGGIFVGLLALAIRRLVEPLNPSGGVLRGDDLVEYAARLGVSLKHVYDSNGSLLEPELQRRVLESEKALRERKGYLVAVGAAVFSGLSALAAWIVHFK